MHTPDKCSCGQPTDYDIHCKNCLFDGLYANACEEVRQELGLQHGEWLTSRQMFEAEARADRELNKILKGPCPKCDGSGKVNSELASVRCDTCGGNGAA